MAQLIINIPDDKVVELRDGICEALRYDPASGMSKIDFVKQQIIRFLKNTYANHTGEKAADTSRQTAINSANQINIT